MSFVRNVVHDLVEKRLWPIALGLVVLIAAVPVLLNGGGSSVPAAVKSPAPAAPSSATTTTASLLTVGDTVPERRNRGGKLRDPFAWPKAATTSSASTSSAPVASSPASSSSSSSSSSVRSATPVASPSSGYGSSGSGSGVSVRPTTPTTTTTRTTRYFAYAITMKFGQTGDQKTIKNLARLAPLPSKKNPVFLFLGVRDDGKTAAFLMPSYVDAVGDGKCYPSQDRCSIIELKAGDTEYFDVPTADGKLVQYQMDLNSVRVVQVDAPKAKAAAANVSREGQLAAQAASEADETGRIRDYLGRVRFLSHKA